mgnify:CR=1 FL=1
MLFVQLVRLFRRVRARKGLGIVMVGALLALAVIGNTVCFYVFDGAGEDAAITVGDALWYSIISVTTIGYGDLSAQTTGARIGTAVFIVGLGLTAFSMFFGLAIDWFTEMALKGDRGMGKAYSSGHTLIVHFPSAPRVEQLIREMQSDRGGAKPPEIVVISDRIEHIPFDSTDVTFIRGSSLSSETYRRAGIEKAEKAIVLATDYGDPDSDAVVASACSVIDTLKSEIHIVAECLDDDHRQLFESVNADAVISCQRMTGNLLVQESQDQGISQMFDIVTSNIEGDTLYSIEVGDPVPTDYVTPAKRLLDENINLLTVVRGRKTFTTFSSITPERGDRLIYLSDRWRSWDEIAACCGSR